MIDWTEGYVTDVGYTFGYYQELNPLRLKYALLNSGYACPRIDTACELGFGQGVSINIHAAASTVEWCGTDFNPSHVAFAKAMAGVSGSGVRLFDDAFAQFAARRDLPDFDCIGLHGTWSWISDDNRRVLVDFLARKLKVGGVLYLSYNALPGWAAFAPMRHVMTEHLRSFAGEAEGLVPRINRTIEFAEKLLAANPAYALANPQIAERFKTLKGQDRHYLAHEYFNRDWQPMHFASLADWLKPAKLQFACAAHILDDLDALNLTADHQALLKEVRDPRTRQTVRDHMVNRQFRRDCFVRGPMRLSSLDQVEQLKALRLMLVTPRSNVAMKVSGALGEATLSEPIYTPILDVMADHVPRTWTQIEQGLKGRDIGFAQLAEAISILVGAGHLAPLNDDAVAEAVAPATRRLNDNILMRARSGGEIGTLASPRTGGGVPLGRFGQLFLIARSNGKTEPDEWAAYAWYVLSQQGQRILKDGKTLETDAENLAELRAQAAVFATQQIPALQALMVL